MKLKRLPAMIGAALGVVFYMSGALCIAVATTLAEACEGVGAGVTARR